MSLHCAANELRNSTVFAMNMFTCNAERETHTHTQSETPKDQNRLLTPKVEHHQMRSTVEIGEGGRGRVKGGADQVDGPLVGDGDGPRALLLLLLLLEPLVPRRRCGGRMRRRRAHGAPRRGRLQVAQHGGFRIEPSLGSWNFTLRGRQKSRTRRRRRRRRRIADERAEQISYCVCVGSNLRARYELPKRPIMAHGPMVTLL